MKYDSSEPTVWAVLSRGSALFVYIIYHLTLSTFFQAQSKGEYLWY